ncbi:MAG: ribonuclease [Verrucomicrobia bacterium]|nr:ribonuclease [Verrucomicrobiota bacterium]
MRAWLQILVTAAKNWNTDNVFKHSAAVSFYTLFSLAPVTIIAVTIAGAVFGRDAATQQFNTQIGQLMGKASAEVIQSAIKASESHGESWLARGTGIFLLIIGATTVFGQLQESLNAIWSVKTKPTRSGWLVLVIHRLASFAMVVTVGFLLMVSLIVTTALTSLTSRFQTGALTHTLDFLVALVVITLLFALLFKFLPDVELRWRDVWLGAFVTSLLFSGGRFLIALYLGHSTVASIYGAAGSLVALLIWVYYSCAIMFYGVEFTKAYRMQRKVRLVPKQTAVVVREEVVEKPIRAQPRT